MTDKVEKVMNEWNDHRQEVIDKHDPNSDKGSLEMYIMLQTSVWMDKLYRATINGDPPKVRRTRKKATNGRRKKKAGRPPKNGLTLD